jgi:hypothetical protein
MTGKLRHIWKETVVVLSNIARHLPYETQVNMRNASRVDLFVDQDMNPGDMEHDAVMLPIPTATAIAFCGKE